jgi:hypothetical protein
MPWWAIIYLVGFVAVCFYTDVLMDTKGPQWRKLVECVAGLSAAMLFSSYWLQDVRELLGDSAPWIFCFILGWEICSAPADFREVWRDPDLSKGEKAMVLLVAPVLVWPLFVFAGMGAF